MGKKNDVNAIVINSIPYSDGLKEAIEHLKSNDPNRFTTAVELLEQMKVELERGHNCFRDHQAIGT